MRFFINGRMGKKGKKSEPAAEADASADDPSVTRTASAAPGGARGGPTSHVCAPVHGVPPAPLLPLGRGQRGGHFVEEVGENAEDAAEAAETGEGGAGDTTAETDAPALFTDHSVSVRSASDRAAAESRGSGQPS